jgi:hypothetical protein
MRGDGEIGFTGAVSLAMIGLIGWIAALLDCGCSSMGQASTGTCHLVPHLRRHRFPPNLLVVVDTLTP